MNQNCFHSFFQRILCYRSFQPQVLGFLLRLFTGAEAVDHIENTMLAKYLTGLVLVIIVLISAFIMHHTSLGQQLVGMRVRIAVSAMVYRKVSPKSSSLCSHGKFDIS